VGGGDGVGEYVGWMGDVGFVFRKGDGEEVACAG
jgi:hypothetical protein